VLHAITVIGNLILYVLPEVAGVVIGGIFIQWYWTKRANESLLIDYLTKKLVLRHIIILG